MRLSTVFELLLIFLLIAFAAYGRVIDHDEFAIHRAIRATNGSRQGNMGVQVMSLKQAAENVNRYCTCNEHICNCCRNFNIPIVQLKGPGCASLQYLERDKLAVQLSMGDNILTSTVVNGQKPQAVCFPMPGGLTKFCGRIYSIQREADNHFKACLGLELQSSSELEAALRVSCFRFGPDGVKLRPAEQLPIVEDEDKPSDDDDDDDDLFGLDDDDDEDDEDDDDDDAPEGNAVPGSSGSSDDVTDDDEDDDDDDDVLGLGSLFDLLTGEDEPNKKKKPQGTTAAPILPFTIPFLTRPTTGGSTLGANDISEISNDVVKPLTEKPEVIGQSIATGAVVNDLPTTVGVSSDAEQSSEELGTTQLSSEIFTTDLVGSTDVSVIEESSLTIEESASDGKDKIIGAGSNGVEYVAKPDKQLTVVKKVSKIVKGKKPSLTSGSPNAIKNDSKKPLVSSVIITKPIKPDPVQNYVVTSTQNNVNNPVNEDEDDDDDDLLGTSDLDDDDEEDDEDDEDDEKFDLESETDEDDDEKIQDEQHEIDESNATEEDEEEEQDEDEKNEEQHEEDDVADLIDDDEDDEEEEAEEDAVLTALIEDDDSKVKNKVADKISTPVTVNHKDEDDDDDADYGLGLAELLTRRRNLRSGRQSKVMRL